MTAAAKAKVPGGTVVRVENDADGNAAYEAHMAKADGTPVTVYVDKDFNVVSVETGGPGGHGSAARARRRRAVKRHGVSRPEEARRVPFPRRAHWAM